MYNILSSTRIAGGFLFRFAQLSKDTNNETASPCWLAVLCAVVIDRMNTINWNLWGEKMLAAGIFAAGVNSSSRGLPQSSLKAFQALRESSCPSRNHRLLPALANNSIGHHRDKLGAGYACSMQAMSCASRAMPDLLIGHHRDKLGAGYAQPMRALAVARRPDGRPPPLACFLNASRLPEGALG